MSATGRSKGRGNGEGSIYQRSDGKWCAAISLAGGKRKVLYGRTRKDVANRLAPALTRAEQCGLVARNVVHLVDAPRAVKSEPRVLQPEEATAFLTSARGDELEYLFATMLATGLRAGEARGLRWTDAQLSGPAPAIQVRRQVIDVQGKGSVFDDPKSQHGRRDIPLIPQGVAAIQAQRRRVAEM